MQITTAGGYRRVRGDGEGDPRPPRLTSPTTATPAPAPITEFDAENTARHVSDTMRRELAQDRTSWGGLLVRRVATVRALRAYGLLVDVSEPSHAERGHPVRLTARGDAVREAVLAQDGPSITTRTKRPGTQAAGNANAMTITEARSIPTPRTRHDGRGVPACPAWCVRGAGHGMASPNGELRRFHLGDLLPDSETSFVTLVQFETVSAGGELRRGEVGARSYSSSELDRIAAERGLEPVERGGHPIAPDAEEGVR